MGAMISMGRSPSFSAGEHGSTFGGNPVVAAAANAVIDTIESEGLMDRASVLHLHLRSRIEEIPGVKLVRGRGLLIGIVLESPHAKEVVARLQEHGVLVNAPGEDVIRLAPPLIIKEREADQFVSIFKDVMVGMK